MAASDRKFKGKSFTTFTMLWSFFFMALSGIIMYIRPEGSIAEAIGWDFFGVSKKGWEGLHTIFVVFFILIAAFHLFFNWKVLLSYFKTRMTEGFRYKKEFIAATVLTLLVLLFSLMQWQPLWKLMDWRGQLKNWDRGAQTVQFLLYNTDESGMFPEHPGPPAGL